MVDRNAETPEDKRITFRIGINLGDIIVEGDDIYGDGVNIAARLEALAEPGGICISRTVRDKSATSSLHVRGHGRAERQEHRAAGARRCNERRRRGLDTARRAGGATRVRPPRHTLRPAVIAASAAAVIAIGVAAWWVWPHRNSLTISVQTPAAASPQIAPVTAHTPVPRLSIVVLPFANLSNDPEQEYFADGDHRRSDDRPVAHCRQLRDRPHHRLHLQGQVGRREADRPRARRALRSRRQRAAAGEQVRSMCN